MTDRESENGLTGSPTPPSDPESTSAETDRAETFRIRTASADSLPEPGDPRQREGARTTVLPTGEQPTGTRPAAPPATGARAPAATPAPTVAPTVATPARPATPHTPGVTHLTQQLRQHARPIEDPVLTRPIPGAPQPTRPVSPEGRTTRLPVGDPTPPRGSTPPADDIAPTMITPVGLGRAGVPGTGTGADTGYPPQHAATGGAPDGAEHQISRPFAPQGVSGSVEGMPAAGSQGPMPVGSVLGNRYRITKVLGVGGMGEVYAVRDEALDIDVALKVMRSEVAADSSFLQRFRNELLVARQITHPNVVRIHDLGQDGSLLFMTMDMVEGRSLGDLMEVEGPLDTPKAVAIVRQVADALATAHAKGVVHRDLKPANILLDVDGDAFVTDFGIARSHSFSGLTRTGEVLGTPDYLAPEQARGEQVDGRTDIYALGLIFFELVSGEKPFSGGTLVEILAQHMHGQTRTFQELGVQIDPGIEAVIARCLAPDLAERYATAEELVADLDDLEKPRQRQQAEERKQKANRALRTGVAVAAGLLLVLGAYWVWISLGSANETAIPVAPPQAPTAQAVPDLPSVLILPLRASGEDPGTGGELDTWARFGLPEQLEERLSGGGGLRVLPLDRVRSILANLDFAELPGDADLAHAAELFDADQVLLGELARPSSDAGTGWTLKLEALGRTGTASDSQTSAGETSAAARRPIFESTTPAASPFELVDAAEAALESLLGTQLADGITIAETAEARDAAALAYYRGRGLASAGDSPAAEEAYREAVGLAEDFGDAWVALGEALQARGDHAAAHDAAKRAVETAASPGKISTTGAHRARVLLTRLDGQPDKTRAELQRWVRELPGDSQARFQLALTHGDLGEIDKAIETLDTLRQLDPTSSQVWYYLGRFTIIAGDPGRAVDDFLVEALAQARRAGDAPGEAQILNAMGVGYQHLGKLEQARRRYADAGEIRLAIGDRNGYAVAQLNLGRMSMAEGKAEEAESQLRQALETFEEIGNASGQADAVNAIGVLRERQGRNADALEQYRQALRLRLEAGDRLAAAESYYNVGFAYLEMANYTDAGLNLEQALTIYRELQNAYGTMLVLQSRASARIAQGAWADAKRDLLEALTTSRELQIPLATAASRGSLAELAALRGRYDEALREFDLALEIVDAQDDLRGRVEFGLGKAEVLLELGDSTAAVLLDRVDGWLSEGGSAAQRSNLRRLQGRLALEGDDEEAARDRFAEAVSDAEASQSTAILLEARLANAGTTDTAALRSVLAEARRLGHMPLELLAAEALAEAHFQAGSNAAVDEPLRRALDLERKADEYGYGYRIHALRARWLRAKGETGDGDRAMATAVEQLDRVIDHLPEEAKAAFLAREPVAAILAERQSAEPTT